MVVVLDVSGGVVGGRAARFGRESRRSSVELCVAFIVILARLSAGPGRSLSES
jgi:hypothetical protein